MNLCLIGPPGAGKGTHVTELTESYGLEHVATGDLFRQNLRDHTALGILARQYMERGELAPDELVDAMVEERLWRIDADRGILFDGFPRTRLQAEFLEDVFRRLDRKLDVVIYLRAPDEELVRRLCGRLVCRDCGAPFHQDDYPPAKSGVCDVCGGELQQRPDDHEQMVRTRLRAFHRVTSELIDYYAGRDLLVIVDAAAPVDETRQALASAVEAVLKGESLVAAAAEVDRLKALHTRAVALTREEAALAGRDIVLLGGPGSGKGTQAEYLCEALQAPHIATGDLFRENLKNETELGRLAKGFMDRGELVPDNITESMVAHRLQQDDARDGFVLDGFPRTLAQAEALTDMLNEMHRRLSAVVYIEVSDDEIVRRLSGRLICRQCQAPFHREFNPPAKEGVCDACGGELYQRDDDNPETVRARLRTFHAQTEPLIAYYERERLLVRVDGEGSVDDVTDRVMAAVGEALE